MSKRYLFILLAIIIVAAGAATRYIIFYSSPNAEEQQLKSIHEQIWHEIEVMEAESKQVKNILDAQDSISFTASKLETKYPYFIYANGNVIFWSDYRFVPDHSMISGNYSLQVFNFKHGKYLVHRRAFVKHQRRVEIISVLPLYKRYKISNDYLESGLNEDLIPYQSLQVVTESSPYQHQHTIYTRDGKPLFVVEMPEEGVILHQLGHVLTVISAIIALAIICWQVVVLVNRLEINREYEWGFLLITLFLVSIRSAMLYFGLPNAWVELDLFSSKFYGYSYISPSLGDLLLNVGIVILLLAYLFTHFYKSRFYRFLINLPRLWRICLSIFLAGVSNWVLYLHFYVLDNIYLNSQLTLDITTSIDFSYFKIICLIIFIINSCIYFFSVHLLGLLFIRINRESAIAALAWILIGTVLFTWLCYRIDILYPFVILLNTGYFLLIFYFRLPRSLYKFKYATSIYLFTAALVCAAIGAFAIYNLEKLKHINNQQKFGEQLLAQHERLDEFLLNEATKSIQEEPLIRSRFTGSSFISQEVIEQKIKRVHLKSYLYDKYDTEIFLFNSEGEPMQSNSGKTTYWEYLVNYKKERYKTDYANLSFISRLGGSVIKEYISFIPVESEKKNVGYVIVWLKLKRIIPASVYPELLVDKRFIQSQESRQYSYAIYKYNNLIYSEGAFNYRRFLDIRSLDSLQASSSGVVINKYLHIMVNGEEGKRVVVSALQYPVKSLFSNFSFLFLVLVLCIVVFIIGFTLRYRAAKVNTSFATKIQVYLNLAFFLPLFVISIATLSIISSAYKKNLGKLFLRNAENVSSNLRQYVDNYKSGSISQEELSGELIRIARYSGSDVNIFDESGRLTATSQPLIYEDELLSPYINPAAYIMVAEMNDKEVMMGESVGKLNYNSVYVGVKSDNGSELLGIISIPFFESKAELDRQMIEVLSTIMNIFTAIFLCFLVFSYFASRILTVPLRLITQKIQKTTLHDYNDPLEWESDDEIGLLVNEYNRMLVKLEESKQALSRSEKESAWREMAQQVAHEIKNPLTPMKLTLQHLQRTLLNGNGSVNKTSAEKSFTTLLDQVDTLNDIATSFSAFAKMPTPKEEVFEIGAVLRKTIELYSNDEDVEITTEIVPGECYVKGDQQLMSRIFTNLILNGIQSVPNGRKPHIFISLQKNVHNIRVEITDNGVGIPENIRNKIFIPNFSTKYAGSGIGLAVAKRGVEHAGGIIWFESEEGEGTSFFIQLPLSVFVPAQN
ncbi:two-component sensor histidine kinase [Rhodocytophaga rosea]|uniref:histidine kinase n=1 Tax=Rhodocytophaga rosea TaxID=2704465 RepID=A0A6C0GLC4_9BACT|nr:HAMP domain-containing sensor histidine kinase [Rhodocytophaga rosea]QHT68432.1 two-component sensor histidine kinase [Rhodocytophaga rosea]